MGAKKNTTLSFPFSLALLFTTLCWYLSLSQHNQRSSHGCVSNPKGLLNWTENKVAYVGPILTIGNCTHASYNWDEWTLAWAWAHQRKHPTERVCGVSSGGLNHVDASWVWPHERKLQQRPQSLWKRAFSLFTKGSLTNLEKETVNTSLLTHRVLWPRPW